VSITNHKTIDLASVEPTTIKLRAKVWDPNKNSKDRSVALKVGLYTKKVNGQFLPLTEQLVAPESQAVGLVLKPGDEMKKVKHYAKTALLSDLWLPAELAAVDAALDPGEKAYLCVSSAVVTPDVDKFSTQVRKRLGVTVNGGPVAHKVRDCVKVIDSNDTPA
jgi:hypothetical protein